jgi:hypothetical protein
MAACEIMFEEDAVGIKKRIALIGIIVSILAGFVSGLNIIGEKAGLASVLIIFFSGFGGGASLVAFLIKNVKK